MKKQGHVLHKPSLLFFFMCASLPHERDNSSKVQGITMRTHALAESFMMYSRGHNVASKEVLGPSRLSQP